MKYVSLLILLVCCHLNVISQISKSKTITSPWINSQSRRLQDVGNSSFSFNENYLKNRKRSSQLPVEVSEISFDLSFILMSEHIWINDYWGGAWNKSHEIYNGYGIDIGIDATYGYRMSNFMLSLDLGLANYYFWTRLAGGVRTQIRNSFPYLTFGLGSNSGALAGDGIYFKIDTELGWSIPLNAYIDIKPCLQIAHNLDAEALGLTYNSQNNPYKEKYDYNILWIPKFGLSFHGPRY